MGINLLVMLPVFAGLMHGIWNFILKKSDDKMLILCLGQLIGGSILLVTYVFIEDSNSYNISKWMILIIVSGILHATSLNFLSKAYNQIGISLVLPISRGVSIIVSVVTTYFFFSESITTNKIFGVMSVIIGILVLNSRSYKVRNFDLLGVIYSVIVGIIVSLYTVFDKYAINTINPVLFSSTTSIMTSTLWFCFNYFNKKIRIDYAVIKKNLIKGTIVGLGGVIGYAMCLYALLDLEVYTVLIAAQSSIIFGSLLGVIFLKEHLDSLGVLSIFLIIIGIISISLKN